MTDLTLKDVFNDGSIMARAKDNWNFKSKISRQMCGKKYSHIFMKHNLKMNDWINDFDDLSISQQKLLLKSEIIRTYDSLPNTDKSKIKNKIKLTVFASKWYKLPSEDKKKILKLLISIN